MAMRFIDYRFWLLVTTLAVGLLVACSSTSPTPDMSDGAPGSPAEAAADSMTRG